GRAISLSPAVLPYYATLSLARMTAAYALSLAFTLIYGYKAAFDRRARRVLLPLLDVLQSVPILSFLPVVLLSLTAVLPQALAAELAAIVLIFTSQVWNLTFAWYQSLRTVLTCLQSFQLVQAIWLCLRSLSSTTYCLVPVCVERGSMLIHGRLLSTSLVLLVLAAGEARAEQTIVFFRHGEKPS